jgi:predicted metal-dependent hydrolase
MARRDEGEYPLIFDRGVTKPGGLLRENPPGGGSFASGRRWLGHYSPLRGCSGLAALVRDKIPRRSTPRNFQTGSNRGIHGTAIAPRNSSARIQIAESRQALFTGRVPFEFILNATRELSAMFLEARGRRIPVAIVRNPRARRYVLRLRPDSCARLTIPRGGSVAEARRFAERNAAWLERALQRLSTRPARPAEWLIGTEILVRGEPVRIEAGVNGESGCIRLGGEIVKVTGPAADLRRAIERHLWRLAAKELPARVLECAAAHQLSVRRVTVRNQRSRWGSCSRRGTISLNWRLIQAPPFVRDYLILHELMHLREMNHSARFWREVERVCPGYKGAERWLKQHAALLR